MDLATIVGTRSARVEALIDEARSKIPRVEEGSSSVGRPVRRCSARYGMRGVRVGEASHRGTSSFLRLRRATSVVAVAPTQVDSGRFSVLDDYLSDTDVDEGGVEALSLLAVDESSNLERVPSEVIAMSDAEGPTVGRRSLVLVAQQEVAPTVPSVVSGESHAPSEVESDVESLPVLNPDITNNEHSFVEEDMPIVDLTFGAAARAALQGLDDVDLEAEFCTRACVMKSPPAFLRGHYRSAMRFALSESDRARDRNDPVGATRAWKLFLLLPRLLLHRPARGGNIPTCRLKDRFSAFAAGQWGGLLHQSRECSEECAVSTRKRHRSLVAMPFSDVPRGHRFWSNSESCHQGGTLLKELR